jgi:DNA-binding transcriptional regulator YiaG
MVALFGDCLITQINIDTRHRATPIAVRQWLKNNTGNQRRIIGAAIKAARYRANVSQVELAAAIGCNYRNVSTTERGIRLPADRVNKIAAYLNDDGLNQLLSTISNSGQ